MMNMNVNERILALREVMQRERLAACIFPSNDPHHCEQTPRHWRSFEWISGYTEPMGMAVVTLQKAALWVPSRSFQAAKETMSGTEYQLMTYDASVLASVSEWIGREIIEARHPYSDWTEVAIDGMCWPASRVRQLIGDLRRRGGLTVRTNFDALRDIWSNRPPVPASKLELQMEEETTASKLNRLRAALREKHADGMLMASLGDIAWTLNLQSTDAQGFPAFAGYLLVSTQRAIFFVPKAAQDASVAARLKAEGVFVDDYENVKSGLKNYFEYNILLDPDEVSYTLIKAVAEVSGVRAGVKSPVKVIEESSPVPLLR